MLTGLDHVIIAVRDLDSAAARLSRATGLLVTSGGTHPGWGTHNAIMRFGLDYLELIAIQDRTKALGNARGAVLNEFLERHGEGLLGFALGSDNLSADLAAMRGRGVEVGQAGVGSRRRPDGTLLHWQLAKVAEDVWGQRMPFLIQHEAPPAQRLARALPGGHPLTATGISAVSVGVSDLEAAIGRNRQYLGGEPEAVEDVPALPARRAVFHVGALRLELLQPAAEDGGLAGFVRARGDGLFLVTLAVPDVDRAVEVLVERGTAVGRPTRRRRAPLLDPSETLGARFQLAEQA